MYLEEILKSLMERNIIIDDSKIYRLAKSIKEIEIPETIQEIVLARENGNAEKHFSKSLEIFKSLGRRYEMALVMEHLGMVKISKGQNEDGRKYVDDAKQIFKEFGVEGY